MVDAIGRARNQPSVLISTSGAGIYGDRGEEIITESSRGTSVGFLAEVATVGMQRDEMFKRQVSDTFPVRTALALGKDGGAIPWIRTVFQFGFEGKLGSGKQWMPRVHITDIAARFLHALETESIHGPINGASPIPLRNEAFAKVMGEILRRPTLFTGA